MTSADTPSKRFSGTVVRLAGSLTWQRALLALLVVVGLFFRLRQYAFDRSLWLDEALLAKNVLERPVHRLLTGSLDHGQGAPAGFLLLTKSLAGLLGRSDLVLRLIPTLAGLLSLPVAYRLAVLTFHSTAGRVCLTSLVAFAPVLIYYTSEFKQYSVDLFFCLLLLWVGLSHRHWRGGRVALAVLGSVAVWLSHPAAFVLVGVGLALLLRELKNGRVRQAMQLVLLGAVWLLSLALLYYASLRRLLDNQGLLNYWQDGFAPVPPTSAADLHWYLDSALGLVYLAFRQTTPMPPPAIADWFDPLNWALLGLTLVGSLALATRHRRLAATAGLTTLETLIAAGLQVYPFRNRLILFLVPFVFICVSALMDWLALHPRRWPRAIATGLTAGLLMLVLTPSLQHALRPYNGMDIKGAMAYLRDHRHQNDILALSLQSSRAYGFYAPDYGLADLQPHADLPQDDPDHLLSYLCQQSISGRVWVLFSHRAGEREQGLRRLNAISPPLDVWNGDGSAIYLYDLAPEIVCAEVGQ
jgi:hypothetical protein